MELQIIQSKIFEVRGKKVILDFHLAQMYQVETRALKQAVKRNMERFPSDFMIILTENELNSVMNLGVSQNVIPLNYNTGGSLPFAFTEQGVAMLSTVLRSKTAIEINISIMRAFVMLRQIAIGYEELLRRIEDLELSSNMQFNDIYQALTELASKKQIEEKPKNPIGFKRNE